MADKNNKNNQPLRPLYLAHVRQRTGDLFPAALRKSYAV